ncbi:hypothetical protein BaRGS_00037035 [Batillaria attramentaria]|uniref:UBC core domain-containing protein n=1 Tax=Batillaria attramentaria TaxID=370345 RepID=A0ABD0J9T1_9CAEN
MAAADSQRKRAMRRLVLDQEELRKSPVTNVSAAPLDSDMFEWHCNIQQDDVIYHLILFMPHNYPFESPSAEFLPKGFAFYGGATMDGKKGTKVCLSIFSDFAEIHTEWKDEKGMGWSPGYSTQTVLMNLVAFLAETAGSFEKSQNSAISKHFKCSDCGHKYSEPFPPLKPTDGLAHQEGIRADDSHQGHAADIPDIIDYISKERFVLRMPKSRDQLYGYGLVVSGPPHRPALTTPCEFLSGESFFNMQTSVGVVHSTLKEELKFFLPMYIHPTHGTAIKDTFENTMLAVGKILPSVDKSTSFEEIVVKTIPNLMAATVVEFSKGTQHTSDNSLNGYFALHRLLLWALDTYPKLQQLVDAKLQDFIARAEGRTKTACPNFGEWLMLLSASEKYNWKMAADTCVEETFRRNVMWYVKDDVKLGYLDTDSAYRLQHTFARTEVSRKVLAFQVLFLDIALPSDKTRAEVVARYDAHYGFPTPEMVSEMKAACDRIKNDVKTYDDWFRILKMEPWTRAKLTEKLVDGVRYSIHTDGYHMTNPHNAGGWTKVLLKYRGQENHGARGGGADRRRQSNQGRWRGDERRSAGMQRSGWSRRN